jgi:hypothetical protein
MAFVFYKAANLSENKWIILAACKSDGNLLYFSPMNQTHAKGSNVRTAHDNTGESYEATNFTNVDSVIVFNSLSANLSRLSQSRERCARGPALGHRR